MPPARRRLREVRHCFRPGPGPKRLEVVLPGSRFLVLVFDVRGPPSSSESVGLHTSEGAGPAQPGATARSSRSDP
jgi:hypothetical protein